MRAINESFLEKRPDSGLTKRLRGYRKRLTNKDAKRIYDDKAVAMLLAYAFEPWKIEAELKYLANLTDDRGRKFCRSIGEYEDIKVQIDNFLSGEKPSFRWNSYYQAAIRKVAQRYSAAKLKSLKYSSSEDIYEAVTDWSTSAGWEGYVNNLRKKRDFLGDGLIRVHLEREAEALKNGSFMDPIILGTRTQGSGAYDENGERTHTCKMKRRFVSVVALHPIITESRFAEPLTQWLKDYAYSAIGKPDPWLTNWVNEQRRNGRYFISLDYSKYDSTIPSWLIRSAFDIIRTAFSEYDEQLLALCEEDFINKNFILADGVGHATHGNPSGSRFTAIVNGICNEIITETWLAKFGIDAEYNIMGDDNLIYVRKVAVEGSLVSDVSNYIMHNFGVKVNSDKSNYGDYSKDPEYLSRYWSSHGPWRWFGDIISLIAYPEKFRNYNNPYVKLTPALIIWSYILGYKKSMTTIIDVPRFMAEQHVAFENVEWTKELRESIPYNLRTYVESMGLHNKPNYKAYLADLQHEAA